MNRCDAPALQHKIRAKSKRTAVFFANSRLRDVEMGGGGWKRAALDGKKERFVRKKTFGLRKRQTFSAYAKLSDKEKLFTNATKLQLSTAPKLTCSNTFRIPLATVSLHYNNPFSKKHRSCVCTTVTLSHRFKASLPAFCGQNRFRHEPPESFTKSFPAEL